MLLIVVRQSDLLRSLGQGIQDYYRSLGDHHHDSIYKISDKVKTQFPIDKSSQLSNMVKNLLTDK